MSSKAKYMVKHIHSSPITGKRLTFAQRGALEQLADDHLEDRGYAHASVKDIGVRMGITRNNAYVHLQALERERVIESRARVSSDGKTRLPNDYRFWFDPPFDAETTRRTDQALAYAANLRASAPVQMSFNPHSESIGGVDPLKGEGTPDLSGGVPPASGEGSLLTTSDLRERETARTRETASNDAANALNPLLIDIALAHPYAQLRRWTSEDVPMPVLAAILDAIKAEAKVQPPIETDRGGSPEISAIEQLGAVGQKLLETVRRIALQVPRSEWRFLKSLEKFMRLREYRMEPEELYHTEPKEPVARKTTTLQPGVYPPESAEERSARELHEQSEAEESRSMQLHYWRSMRDKGERIYETQCPRDIREVLEAEGAAQ